MYTLWRLLPVFFWEPGGERGARAQQAGPERGRRGKEPLPARLALSCRSLVPDRLSADDLVGEGELAADVRNEVGLDREDIVEEGEPPVDAADVRYETGLAAKIS